MYIVVSIVLVFTENIKVNFTIFGYHHYTLGMLVQSTKVLGT